MTKRYYYTDPLAAAWMSKNFGIEYLNDLPKDHNNQSYQAHCIPITHKYNAESFWNNAKYSMGIDEIANRRFYIHPDSEDILNPQVGDIVYRKCQHGGISINEIMEGTVENAEYFIKRGGKIIQRNNIPFMWPETEEVIEYHNSSHK